MATRRPWLWTARESERPCITRDACALRCIFLVRNEQMSEMPLAKDHDMAKAVASDSAAEPLCISIFPGRARLDGPIAYAHRSHSLSECFTVGPPRSRTMYRGPSRQPNASVNCRAIHSAVG